jgi:hypothetical protein
MIIQFFKIFSVVFFIILGDRAFPSFSNTPHLATLAKVETLTRGVFMARIAPTTRVEEPLNMLLQAEQSRVQHNPLSVLVEVAVHVEQITHCVWCDKARLIELGNSYIHYLGLGQYTAVISRLNAISQIPNLSATDFGTINYMRRYCEARVI